MGLILKLFTISILCIFLIACNNQQQTKEQKSDLKNETSFSFNQDSKNLDISFVENKIHIKSDEINSKPTLIFIMLANCELCRVMPIHLMNLQNRYDINLITLGDKSFNDKFPDDDIFRPNFQFFSNDSEFAKLISFLKSNIDLKLDGSPIILILNNDEIVTIHEGEVLEESLEVDINALKK